MLGTSSIPANEGRSAQIEQRMEEAKIRLDLNDDQVDQVSPLLEESIRARKKVLSSYGIDLENRSGPQSRIGIRQARAMRKELGAIQEDTLNELSGILSEQQMEELKMMQEERKAEVRERIRAQRGGG
jgi:hypothetical protein